MEPAVIQKCGGLPLSCFKMLRDYAGAYGHRDLHCALHATWITVIKETIPNSDFLPAEKCTAPMHILNKRQDLPSRSPLN